MFDYLANPARFMRIADRLFWPLVVIATGLLGAGLYYGLLNSCLLYTSPSPRD